MIKKLTVKERSLLITFIIESKIKSVKKRADKNSPIIPPRVTKNIEIKAFAKRVDDLE